MKVPVLVLHLPKLKSAGAARKRTLALTRACAQALVSVLLLIGPALTTIAAARPNLVVILTDDLSVDLLAGVLNSGRLPHLQSQMIDKGISFTNSFVTNSACCPSRATFLRGQYSHNHGVLSNLSTDPFAAGLAWPGWLPGLAVPHPLENSTLATWLHDAGYHTGLIGKYLNGYGTVAPPGINPQTYIPAGWDDWQGLIDPSTYSVYNYSINDNGVVVSAGNTDADYQTDVLSHRATAFIHANANRAKPFFLLVTPVSPHVEVVDLLAGLRSVDPLLAFHSQVRPPARYAYLSDGLADNGEITDLPAKPNFNESDMQDKPSCAGPVLLPEITYNRAPFCPGSWPDLDSNPSEEHVVKVHDQWRTMGAALIAVDDLLGEVIDALAATGTLDRTVVIFTSDNGFLYGEHRLSGKDMPYEESIRVPLYIRGPGFPSNTTARQIVLNNDMAPSLAALAGVVPPYVPDGRSIVPLLVNPAATGWPRKTFLIEHWYIPGFQKFTPPTFFALRSIKAGGDFTYVGWRIDPTTPSVISHEEFYRNSIDPWQLEGRPTLPAATLGNLRTLIQLLRTCGGASCAVAENL